MTVRLPISVWRDLDGAARRRALTRPAATRDTRVVADATRIIGQVREGRDRAVTELTLALDKVKVSQPRVNRDRLRAAWDALDATAQDALRHAKRNIERFHLAQRATPAAVIVQEGVVCRQEVRPIDAVGLYVPGGSAPLPSALLMLAVPAAISGCRRRVVCSPPQADGQVADVVLAAAALCEVDEVYAIGGAQAIAALAYGTAAVAPVDKIFGPGNAYVTAAKMLVAQDPNGAACDLPAGPSEVLVIADAQADADVVAADLLAQAEHGADSQVLLLTDSADFAQRAVAAVAAQVPQRTRAAIIRRSMASSRVLVFDNLDEAMAASNDYAPEHLILNVCDAARRVADVTNAGSVFVGRWAAETFGDYCSGTNHVLPTYGFARAYSGVTLRDFTKTISVQEIDETGFEGMAATATTFARLEGLDAHAAAISVRQAALDRQRGAA